MTIVIPGGGAGGGIAPPAGDIGGTTASPLIVGIDGKPVSSLAGLLTAQGLIWNGSDFVPANMQMLAAETPAGGFALQNATPVVYTWTTPNDGNLHGFEAYAALTVTLAETGGATKVLWTINGVAQQATVFANALAVGTTVNTVQAVADPNTTVTLQQTSALTAGASKIFSVLYGT